MLSASDREELERTIAADPFAGAERELVNALRTDDLVATLFLHRQKPSVSGCVCGTMGLGEHYPLHLADMIRRTMEVLPLAGEAVARLDSRPDEPFRLKVSGPRKRRPCE